jgi:glycine dehydrogenase
VQTGTHTVAVHSRAVAHGINLRDAGTQCVGISLDETTTTNDLANLLAVFAEGMGGTLPCVPGAPSRAQDASDTLLPASLTRDSAYLTHPVFNTHHSETSMLRYLRTLADKDLALDRSMIALGSCTMKLNATSEMMPITWPAFANIHPFAPADQRLGYALLDQQLSRWLCQITGYAGVSLQPNAGSQGEYAGLLAIRAYHQSKGQNQRTICLIPSSAHGTNPASAQMAGLKVVVTACDAKGNVDMADLAAKCEQYSEQLAVVMITYPSTHGVFESEVRALCEMVHQHGGKVYIDGANMNALVGLAAPGEFGGDVSHLNLHKTFCIPHGGGGPGVGPVCVAADLVPFLPSATAQNGAQKGAVGAISGAPLGNAAVLPISWMYIRMMGAEGLRAATESAILSANYISHQLRDDFPTLYSSDKGFVAHECILDCRPLKEMTGGADGISAEDIAKRLIDYGFHAPTLSFPVTGTLMVEPTESEPLQELNRFIDAMKAIRLEIEQVAKGQWSAQDNPLKNAPHTAYSLMSETWLHPYSREQAAYPVASLRQTKYWAPVGRVDNVFGDRNLFCSCPPIQAE